MEYMVLIRADIRCDVWTVDEDGGVGVVPRRRRHSPRKMAVFNEARLVVKRTLRRRRGRGRGRRRGALIPDASAALFAILLLFDLSPRVIMRFFYRHHWQKMRFYTAHEMMLLSFSPVSLSRLNGTNRPTDLRSSPIA